jgi:hypothetical protein
VKATELLAHLTGRSVRLEAFEGRIRVDAPAGILTDQDRRSLVEQKTELLALLSVSTVPAELEATPNTVANNGNINSQTKDLPFVAVIQAARRDRFGPSEWPEDPGACRELGIQFDRIDDAFLARDHDALAQVVHDALELINRLAPSTSMAAPPTEVLSAWRREQFSLPILKPQPRSETQAEERFWTPVLFEE